MVRTEELSLLGFLGSEEHQVQEENSKHFECSYNSTESSFLSSSAFRCKRLFKIEGPRKSSLRKKLQNGSNKRGFGTCQRPLLSWIIHFAPALSKIDIPYVIGRCRVGSNVCVVFLTNAKFCGAGGSTHLDLKKITLFSPSFLDLLIQS